MGSLAILGVLGLFLYGLKWDRRQDPSAAPHLWWPTLWAMRCGARTIDSFFGGGEHGRLDPILLVILIAGGVSVLWKRRAEWSGILRHNSAIFVFYAYLAASTMWSIHPGNPFIKLARPFGDLVMALIIVTEQNPRAALLTVFRRAVLLLLPMSIVLAKYVPHLGRMQSKHWSADTWIGVTTHKNPLGQLVFLAVMVFVWSLQEARLMGRKLMSQWIPLLYLAMCSYIFFLGPASSHSRSTTSIIVTVFGLALLYFVGRFRKSPRTVIRGLTTAALVIGGLSVVLNLMGTSPQAVVAQMQGKAPTLSDRTYLWADVMRIAGQDHPWMGAGYGAFFNPTLYPRLSPEVNNEPAQAHNGYLETYANLGIVGVILLAWLILQSIRSAGKMITKDFEYGRWRIVLIFSVLLMNYAEATFPRGTHLWWFGFLAVALYAQPWVRWPKKRKRASVTVEAGAPGSAGMAGTPRPQAVPA